MFRMLPFALIALLLAPALYIALQISAWWWIAAAPLALLFLIGVLDLLQRRHTLWRNYPVIGHIRWIAEELRPFLRSYIVESETEGKPFNIEDRALVYRRAKDTMSVEPFGSHLDFDRPPYEWITHSIAPRHADVQGLRVSVGGAQCSKPYSASVFNISAMSFGALGANAIEALNRGAAMGGFYHDTGEGGISRYHRAGGGDLVYEVGSGYFGCRASDGRFDPERFRDVSQDDQVKMVELKLSQGAKPGHGGVLPGVKVTKEIAAARGVAVGTRCESPARHSAFSTPIELMHFLAQMRDLSGGKPVGFKLCVGQRHEVLALMKAMIETGIRPDFIVVDGAEGGTGAAPAEFMDHVGAPLREGLVLLRNALVGCGLKTEIRLACSGKQLSGASLASSMALGADWVNSARGFMFALGCIQSLNCHNNTCPTGIATQDAGRQRGLVIPDKFVRVANYHRNTLQALADLIGAAGCEHPQDLTPRHLIRRVDQRHTATADMAYNLVATGSLLEDAGATHLAEDWRRAQAASFLPVDETLPVEGR